MQCTGAFCSATVTDQGTLCEFCLSTESNLCIGCNKEIGSGSGGYCSLCWQERFGVEEDEIADTTKATGVKNSDVYTTTDNPLIDLSTLLVRGASPSTILTLVKKCIEVSIQDTFVLAFQTRDIRGGKGERHLFDILISALYKSKATRHMTLELLDLVPEYGSWRDLTSFHDSCLTFKDGQQMVDKVCALIVSQLRADSATPVDKSISLCAKWAPREKKNPALTKALASQLFNTNQNPSYRLKLYRKLVADLNRRLDTTEIKMCARTFAGIDPSHVPGRCLHKNMKAFLNEPRIGRGIRHPENPDRMTARQRFQDYFTAAKEGKITVKAANVMYPHEIIKKIATPGSLLAMQVGDAWGNTVNPHPLSEGEAAGLCAQWDAIVKAARETGGLGRSLAMCDFSGSMMSSGLNKDTPFWVSMAMGLLISELTTDEFKDTFLTFDSNPSFHTLTGQTIVERVASIGNVGKGLSTDFQKAMDCILATLKAKRCRPGQEPKDLIVITDMGWDAACGSSTHSVFTGHSYRHVVKTDGWQTHIQMIREAFRRAGEDMWGEDGAWTPPRIVIWNVAATSKDFHAKSDEEGVIILSGWSPSLFKVLTTEGARVQTPLEALRTQLDDPRYNLIRERLAQTV
jgi:hypothetical protein